MRIKHAMFAVAMAAVLTATTAYANVDLSGSYFRDGVGYNASQGGAQAQFQLPNTDFKSRLGNENNTYMEINFHDTMFKDAASGTQMDFVFMPAMGGCAGNEAGRCVSSTGNTLGFASGALYIQQSYGLVKAPTLIGGADIWIGNRYYQRHNIDNYDFFWWNVMQGHGAAGIENVDLGAGKFAFALTRMSSNAGAIADSYVVPDLRFVTVPFVPGGTIEVGVDLALSTGKGIPSAVAGGSAHSTLSPWLTLLYTQTIGALGGDNFIGFQYGSGAFVQMENGSPLLGGSSDQKQWRIFDQLVYHPVPEFSGELALFYQNKTLSNAANDNGFSIINAQLRPAYHVNNWFKLAFDFWYSTISHLNALSGESSPSLFKATFAPTIVAGQKDGLWARPEFRVFVTYATWSNVAAGTPVGSVGGSDDAYPGNTSGITAGAQVEAWW